MPISDLTGGVCITGSPHLCRLYSALPGFLCGAPCGLIDVGLIDVALSGSLKCAHAYTMADSVNLLCPYKHVE